MNNDKIKNEFLNRLDNGEDARSIILELCEKINNPYISNGWFSSYQAYDFSGNIISTGQLIVFDDDKEKEKSFVVSPYRYILNYAKQHNRLVNSLTILSLNRV